MAGKNTAVFGIYRSRAGAEEAVDALRAAGFRNTDVSVLLPENQGTKDFAHEKGTKAPEGAATGPQQGPLPEAYWDGSLVSGRWLFPGLVL